MFHMILHNLTISGIWSHVNMFLMIFYNVACFIMSPRHINSAYVLNDRLIYACIHIFVRELTWLRLSLFSIIRYGKVFKTHILGRPVIVSTDPEVNRVVLLNHGNTFVPWYPKSITELLGKSSILQMNGNLHKRVHSLISCFLKSPQLKARITRQIEISVKLSLSTWKNKHLVYLQDEAKQVFNSLSLSFSLTINYQLHSGFLM